MILPFNEDILPVMIGLVEKTLSLELWSSLLAFLNCPWEIVLFLSVVISF